MGSAADLLTQDFAQRICEILYEETGCSVNMINQAGVVIASTDRKREGTFHSIANTMMERELREFIVTEKDATLAEGVQAGISTWITYKGMPVMIIEVLGESNMIRPFIGIASRMTELWLQNKELLDDLSRVNQTILEDIKDGYYEVDLAGNLTLVNHSLSEILGYPKEELMGMNYKQYTDQESNRNLFQMYSTVYQTKTPVKSFDAEYVRKDGSKRYSEVSISLIRDVKDQPIGFRGIVRDITERKLVEEELRESEQRYRSLVELSPEPIFVHDNGKMIYANPAGLKLLGAASLHEILDKSVMEFVHPDYQEIVKKRVRQVQTEGKPVELIEKKLIRLDGKIIDVEAIILPITYHGQTAIQLLIRDITERKQAEKRLCESEQYYKSLFEHNPDIVSSFDLNGCFISVNRVIEKITGYNKEELLSQPFTSFIVKDQIPQILHYFHLTKSGLSQTHEMTVIHKSGQHVILDVTSVPIIVDGKIVGIYGIGKDITEHKKAQTAIQQLQYKNELILNSVGEGIFGLDQAGKITFCNPAASRMLGYEIDELIGQDSYDVLHRVKVVGDPYPKKEYPILQSLSNGVVHHVADEVFWKIDGSFFPVEYVSTPIQEQGQIAGAVVAFKDITERKRTEEYIRKTEKLSVVGQLAAGVAHEIRNPLTALKGFVQLLKSRVGGHGDYFEVMLSEIDRINSIVNEFLFLAKPQVVHFQQKDLRGLLKNIIALLDTQAIIYNIQIMTDFDPDLPLVRCDENQLKQVFINILKNAIEAMPGGGEIMIQVKKQGSNWVLVRFIDQGHGIPEERIPKLGEPFYTTKEKGTGLGLMVSYKIIEAHDGKMHISSQFQKGTTVDVILPVSEN